MKLLDCALIGVCAVIRSNMLDVNLMQNHIESSVQCWCTILYLKLGHLNCFAYWLKNLKRSVLLPVVSLILLDEWHTLYTMIRHYSLWQLIWVYTICSGLSVPILRFIVIHWCMCSLKGINCICFILDEKFVLGNYRILYGLFQPMISCHNLSYCCEMAHQLNWPMALTLGVVTDDDHWTQICANKTVHNSDEKIKSH